MYSYQADPTHKTWLTNDLKKKKCSYIILLTMTHYMHIAFTPHDYPTRLLCFSRNLMLNFLLTLTHSWSNWVTTNTSLPATQCSHTHPTHAFLITVCQSLHAWTPVHGWQVIFRLDRLQFTLPACSRQKHVFSNYLRFDSVREPYLVKTTRFTETDRGRERNSVTNISCQL